MWLTERPNRSNTDNSYIDTCCVVLTGRHEPINDVSCWLDAALCCDRRFAVHSLHTMCRLTVTTAPPPYHSPTPSSAEWLAKINRFINDNLMTLSLDASPFDTYRVWTWTLIMFNFIRHESCSVGTIYSPVHDGSLWWPPRCFVTYGVQFCEKLRDGLTDWVRLKTPFDDLTWKFGGVRSPLEISPYQK